MGLLNFPNATTNPGSYGGATRRRAILLNQLQADAFRSGSQNQATDQAARSFSGSSASNDQTQSASLTQVVTAQNIKRTEVQSHRQYLITPLAYHQASSPATPITGSTDLNNLINSDGTPVSNTATAGSILGDQATDAHLLVTGDTITITGTEFDGTAVSGTFTYGTDGTTVNDLITKVNSLFTTGTLELSTDNENNGKLRFRANGGGPGMLSIDLDAPLAHVTTTKDGSLTSRVKEVATATSAYTAGGAASSGTPINSLDQVTVSFTDGDLISITGTDANGGAISGSFIYGAANDGTTLGALVSKVDSLFDAGAKDVTTTLSGGKVIMTADDAGALSPDLSFTISDGAGAGTISSKTSSVTTQGANAFSSFLLDHDTAATSVTTATDLNDLDLISDTNKLNSGDEIRISGTKKDGTTFDVDFTYGAANDGTTVGELITFLSATFPAGTASLVSGDPATLKITEDSSSGAEPISIDLQLKDEGKHVQLQDFTGVTSPPMQRLAATVDAADLMARGAANLAQNQGTNQSAFARLNDFGGTDSNSTNNLRQLANASQTFDVDLSTTVLNCTLGNSNGGFFQTSRFRELHSIVQDNQAQAIFTSGQRQGATEVPMTQIAVGDGSSSTNTLTQLATISQTGSVDNIGKQDLTVKEQSPATLQPRATVLLTRLLRDAAVNSSAASQELVNNQSSAGGLDEDGNKTENAGNAFNLGNSSASNTDDVDVLNSLSIVI